jgi:hydroxypyruvate reductase
MNDWLDIVGVLHVKRDCNLRYCREKCSQFDMTYLENLSDLWWHGVRAVQGKSAVSMAIDAYDVAKPDVILAVGKAAASMAAAAYDVYGDVPIHIVTKYHHISDVPPHATLIEAAHPVPDAASLRAGIALRDVVAACPSDAHLLILVSGGASSLAEVLPDGMTLADLTQQTQAMLASGADIHAMNAQRRKVSQIKGGKLLAGFRGARVTSLAISDVEGDALGVIGSGIGDAPADAPFTFAPHIVANNARARTAVAAAASLHVQVNSETLYDDIETLAPRIANELLNGAKGLYIFGGEPTVILPENPGKGGRNMALALLLAREISGHDGVRILVAGTDGTDGPTDAAGALIDGTTWDASAQDAANRADAAPWLDARSALFRSGPTGTNVMDLLIAERI